MNEQEFQKIKRGPRGEAGNTEKTAWLLDIYRGVVSGFVKFKGMPPSFSPYGEWNSEAIEELLQDWLTKRLIEKQQTQALLDKAATLESFKRLARKNLHQHVINSAHRSQSTNVYRNVSKMLVEEDEFELRRDSAKKKDRAWGVKGRADTGTGDVDDKTLAGHAWSLGDFTLVKFKLEARKLSHVLGREDMKRFVRELILAAGCALTLSQITRTISTVFDLTDPAIASLDEDESPEPSSEQYGPADQAVVVELVRAICEELTDRQQKVLLGIAADETHEKLASELECSVGTINGEKRRIGNVIEKYSCSDYDRGELLKKTHHYLYETSSQV